MQGKQTPPKRYVATQPPRRAFHRPSAKLTLRRIRDHLRLFPPAPSPWIPCIEIVRIQGTKIWNTRNSLGHGQGKPSIGRTFCGPKINVPWFIYLTLGTKQGPTHFNRPPRGSCVPALQCTICGGFAFVAFLRSICLGFGQGLRAGQLGADLQYQAPKHKGSHLSLSSSAKSLDLLQLNCPCPGGKTWKSKKFPWTWTREALPRTFATRSELQGVAMCVRSYNYTA